MSTIQPSRISEVKMTIFYNPKSTLGVLVISFIRLNSKSTLQVYILLFTLVNRSEARFFFTSKYNYVVISQREGMNGLGKLTNRINGLQCIVSYYQFATTQIHLELVGTMSTNIVSGTLMINVQFNECVYCKINNIILQFGCSDLKKK